MKTEMSEHGAALQIYNQELVKCLEDLKEKRNVIEDIIHREEAQKVVLENNLKALQEKLSVVNRSLERHKEIYGNYEKTIKETEVGFRKILESSQALLHLAQHEAENLDSSLDSTSHTNTFKYKSHEP